MPTSLNENHPSTTRNRFIIVANTGRLIQMSARPRPLTSPDGGVASGVGSATFIWQSGRGLAVRRSSVRDFEGTRGSIRQSILAGDRHDSAVGDVRKDFLQAITEASELDGI